MLNVWTAGLNVVNVRTSGPAVPVSVLTMLFVHSSVHKNPAVKRSTAHAIDALCEYCQRWLLSNRERAMFRSNVYFVMMNDEGWCSTTTVQQNEDCGRDEMGLMGRA